MNPFALSTLNLASSIYQDPEEALIATAQAVLETGGGKSVPGGNLFGIKGPGSTHRTWEVVNGQPVTTTASFREYGSPEESIAGRMEFLRSNPRYGKAGYFDAATAEEKADALQRAGYATDPNYAAKLKSIVSDLRGSSVQTFPYQAPGMQPAPAPEQSQMMPQPRPTDMFASIFGELQGRPGLSDIAQAAFAMGDVFAPPGQQTGAARQFVMGNRYNLATQIQLARLMQEEERLAAERARQGEQQLAVEALAGSVTDPTVAAALRAGISPKTLGLSLEPPAPAPTMEVGGVQPGYTRTYDEQGRPIDTPNVGTVEYEKRAKTERLTRSALQAMDELDALIAKHGEGIDLAWQVGTQLDMKVLRDEIISQLGSVNELGVLQIGDVQRLSTIIPDPTEKFTFATGKDIRRGIDRIRQRILRGKGLDSVPREIGGTDGDWSVEVEVEGP